MLLTLSQIALLFTGLLQVIIAYVLYGLQFYKIYKNKSVTGISKLFIIFGNIQIITIVCNALIFYFSTLTVLCPQNPFIVCLNDTLGLYQFISSYICNLTFNILYLYYFRYRNKDQDQNQDQNSKDDDNDDNEVGSGKVTINNSVDVSNNRTENNRVDNNKLSVNDKVDIDKLSVNDKVDIGKLSVNNVDVEKQQVPNNIRRSSVTLMLTLTSPLQKVTPVIEKYTSIKVHGDYNLYFIIVVIFDITLITATLVFISSDNWTGYLGLTTFAAVLGYASTICVLIQYIPQFYTLYKTKNSKNLNVVTYLTLAIGNTVTFIYLLYQQAANYTTWLPYLIEAAVQLILSAQIIYYSKIYLRFKFSRPNTPKLVSVNIHPKIMLTSVSQIISDLTENSDIV
jgi:uncharacterized protein with PQ loop repeat